MCKILVVGSIMNDLVLQVERMPKSGESYLGGGYFEVNGGKGANQAVAAARLGAFVSFVGKMGDDANGVRLEKSLKSNGIDTTHLKTDKGTSTGLAVIIVESNGQNRIIVNPGANMNLAVEDISVAYESEYDAVIMQLEMSRDVVFAVYEGAKMKNIPVFLDAGPAQSFPLERLKGMEILSPNETETYALTGIEIRDENDAMKAAAKLKEISEAKYIVIKMGSRGAVLFDGDKYEAFKAYPVDVKDTTAAGDAFTAAMTLEYLRSGSIQRAVQYGNIVGALTVTKQGAGPSLPFENDVISYIKEHNIRMR